MKKIIQNLDEVLAAIVLVILVVVMFLNVLFRQIEGLAFSAFADEITTKLFVLFSLLGASIAAKRKSHLGLTVLTDAVSDKAKTWINFFGYIIAAAFCILLIVYGTKMTINEYTMNQKTLTNQWPEWIFGAFIPIGMLFCTYRFIQCAIATIHCKDGEKK